MPTHFNDSQCQVLQPSPKQPTTFNSTIQKHSKTTNHSTSKNASTGIWCIDDHRWSIVWIDHSQGAALLELPPGLHLTAFRRWNSETVDDNEGWQNVLDAWASRLTLESWRWIGSSSSPPRDAKGQAKYSKVGYESGTYGYPNGVHMSNQGLNTFELKPKTT